MSMFNMTQPPAFPQFPYVLTNTGLLLYSIPNTAMIPAMPLPYCGTVQPAVIPLVVNNEVPLNTGTNINAPVFIPKNSPKHSPQCPVPVRLPAIEEETPEITEEALYPESPSVSDTELNYSPFTQSPSTQSTTASFDYDWAFAANSSPNSVDTQDTQHKHPQNTEHIQDDDEMDFEPKFKGNHAKGNFFISKEMISRMMIECKEPFHTAQLNDEKLAFGYFKESVAMQINDDQIHVICTNKGKVIMIDIDLHFKSNNERMYLVAMLNAPAFRHKVKWQIVDFMTQKQISTQYGITANQLPKSSRAMSRFNYLLKTVPHHVPVDVIYRTKFSKLPDKKSKRNDNETQRVSLSESDFQWYCRESWYNGIMIPVVVIKGKRQWVEWKKFIRVCDDNNGNAQWVGISLRYHPSNKQWKIECMDYDAGRIFYQYRLIGVNNHSHNITYKHLAQYVNTSLIIY